MPRSGQEEPCSAGMYVGGLQGSAKDERREKDGFHEVRDEMMENWSVFVFV